MSGAAGGVGSAPTSLWSNRDFIKLWLGTSISNVGSQLTVLAMPLMAVLMFGAGPAETALMTAAGWAPLLLFGLPAGAWVDRLPKRPLRIAADLASACVVTAIPISSSWDALRLEQLYIVAFLIGSLNVLTRLTSSALLPALVGREQLLEANTATMASFSLTLIVGPALAGVLVQVVAPPLVLLLDAVTFVASAACFLALNEPSSAAKQRDASTLRQEVVEGLRWLWRNPVLFPLTVSIGMANLAWFSVYGVLVPFATYELRLEPAQVGLALGAIGPPGLVGALLAAGAARRYGPGPTMTASLTGEMISRVLLLVAGGPPLLATLTLGLAQGVFGLIAPLWDVNANSLRQSLTPARLLGRVTAASTFVGVGTAPMGALLGGWIAETAGLRMALLVAALITLVALVCIVRSPVPGLRDLPQTLARQ
ncbi:MAG: MFS transporter [Chloroflexota bacterium]|nr:MFS transporter [Chloroflexota bacterium]